VTVIREAYISNSNSNPTVIVIAIATMALGLFVGSYVSNKMSLTLKRGSI